MAIAIFGVALFFFLGHAFRYIFIKTKIPDLLFLIALGYLLGPFLGILHVEDFGKVGSVLSTIALIVILYEGGLGLKTRELLTSSLPALGLSILTFLLITGITAGLTLLLTRQSIMTGLLVGVGIGSTSSAIVIPMVRYLNISDRTKTVLSLESALTDVLVIVVFLLVMENGHTKNVHAADIFIGLGPNTVKAVLIGLLSGFVWAFLRKKYEEITNVAFTGEAWALLTFSIIELFGLNGALGVLALGYMLSNLELLPAWAERMCNREPVDAHKMELLQQVAFILRTFFFLYLGMLIEISNVKIISFSIVLCCFVFLTRYLATLFLFHRSKYNKKDAMMITAMAPRGLACAVLAMLPLQKGLEGGEFIQNTVFTVVPLTIFLTAVFVFLIEKPERRRRLGELFSKYPEEVEQVAPMLASAAEK